MNLDWRKNTENFLLEKIFNFQRENDLIKYLEPLFQMKYTDLYPIVNKILLNSNQSDLKSTGLELLQKLQKNKEEKKDFIQILEKFSQDSKWNVKLTCSKILTRDTIQSVALLFYLKEDGYYEIEEICKEKLNTYKYSKELLYFIFEQINQREKEIIYIYLQSLKGLYKNGCISMDRDIICMLVTSILNLDLDLKMKEMIDYLTSEMKKDDLIGCFMKELKEKEILLLINMIQYAKGKVGKEKFNEFIEIYSHKDLDQNHKNLIRIIYNEDIEITPQFAYIIIRNQLDGFLNEKTLLLYINLYLNDIKKYFNVNNDWKSNLWTIKSLEWIINKTDTIKIKEYIPFISKIIGDYEFENKIIGFKMLSHFLDILDIEEVKFYDQLLFQFAHDNMVFRDTNLTKYSLPFLIKLLSKLKNVKFYQISMDDFLKGFEYSTREQRKEMLKHFKKFLYDMDIEIIRHFKRIFKILLSEEFLEENTTEETVECIKVIIQNCWIRITKERSNEIIESLKNYKNQNEIIQMIKDFND